MSRQRFRDLARRIFRAWLKQDTRSTFQPNRTWETPKRPIRFEPLENRQLMAGDLYESLLALPGTTDADLYGTSSYYSSTSSTAEGEAEGEDAPDLVAFAKALAAKPGVVFYGAIWCPFCNEQKQLFQDGAQFLPFQEVTNPDRTPNALGQSKNITTYPTWEFPGGTRVTGVQTLQQLSTLAGVPIPTSSTPSMVTIPTQTVLIGSPLHVPVDAYDPNGNPLTITVSSSNPALVTAEVLQNNQSLRMTTEGYGDMVFELFDTEAARVTERIKSLVGSGFYNKTTSNQIIFHRVIDNFVIQAGDPTGTGSGGSSLSDFDDQYDVDLQHNRTGVLSMAKSSDDTNDSQFFITEGPQRNLDFNHSIFGQLVEGETVRDGISQTPVSSGNNKPTTPVVISSMTIFNDTENGLIRLKAASNQTGTATITVTVTDSEGRSTQQTFSVTVAADTKNSAPFLNDLTAPSYTPGQPVTLQLTAQDAEGDAVFYDASVATGSLYSASVNSSTGLVTVTPNSGYTGDMVVTVGVRAATSADTVDTFDTQKLVISASTASPTSVDLQAASDTGTSSTDNITNAGSLTFVVAGTTVGATVNLRVNGSVVGTSVASGTSTTITTNNIAALGTGTYSIVATQTVNGAQSSNSPALSVIYDNVQPIAIANGVIPASANVGTQMSVNLSHEEEGTTLRYSLQNAPAGMTIDAATGLLTWTPTSAQIGNQNFSLVLTDTAGNARTQTFTIGVNDVALGSIAVELVDANGSPLTSATIGQTFKARILVDDLRANPSGVFAAYLDMAYNSALVEVQGAINTGTVYTNARTGSLTTVGVVEEIGGVSASTSPVGSGAKFLGEITFRTKAAGQAIFTTNVPEGGGTEFLLFGRNTAIPFGQVSFGQASLAIGLNFTAANDTFTVATGSSNNSLNVLANDTINAGSGAVLTIRSVSTGSAGGTISIASDSKSLLYTPVSTFSGTETFTYSVGNQDGATATATLSVTVSANNNVAVAVNDTLNVNQGSTGNVLSVLNNDNNGTNGTSANLTITSVGATNRGGTVTIAGDKRTVLYTPVSTFSGTETFTYTISNGTNSSTGTVTVNVNPLVPPPTANGDTFTMVEDGAVQEIDVLANDTPAATGQTLTVTAATSSNGTAGVTSDFKKVTYKPNANFAGTDFVVYTLRGSNGGVTTGTLTVTVTNVNDAPTAVNDDVFLTAASNQSGSFVDVLSNDTDPDTGDKAKLVITAITQPASGQGSVTINSGGKSLNYSVPSNDFAGTVTFTYTIGDGSSLTSTATVKLNVQAFSPRNIFFNTASFAGDNFLYLSNDQVTLSGQTFAAKTASYTPNSNSTRSLEFNEVAPGDYRLIVPQLPFFVGQNTDIALSSGINEGNSLNNQLALGQVMPNYFDIRDFMGESMAHSLTVAVVPGKTSIWAIGQGDWKQFESISVRMNSDQSQLLIDVTTATGTASGRIAVGVPGRSERRGTDGASQLFRIMVSPTSLNLNPSTIGDANTNANNSDDSEGEGEGAGLRTSTTANGEGEGSSALPLGNATLNATTMSSTQPGEGEGSSSSNLSGSTRTSSPAPTSNASTANDLILEELGLGSSDSSEGEGDDEEGLSTEIDLLA